MELSFGKGLIRSFRSTDAAQLAALADNHLIWLQLRDAFPRPYRLEDAQAFIEIAVSEETETKFALDLDGSPIGTIGIQLQSDVNRGTGEIGYWLGEPYWGRGIATAAATAFSEWAIRNYSLRRVFASPFADNAASRRVLEKAGFRFEGILHRSAIKDGQVKDQATYALLAADTHVTGTAAEETLSG